MKIALVASEPGSADLAPFDDPSWTIWACGPATFNRLPRLDAWFELHPFDPLDAKQFPIPYLQFMHGLECPVYMHEPVPEVPQSIAYPREAMRAKFGPFFFTSSVAWMLALAIDKGPDEIGLWGIDMAINSEYLSQRPGCQHFLDLAMRRGIKITVPPQSDLMQPPPEYGYCDADPMWIKLTLRMERISRRLADAKARRAQADNDIASLAAALDAFNHVRNTWVTDAVSTKSIVAVPTVRKSVNGASNGAHAIEAGV